MVHHRRQKCWLCISGDTTCHLHPNAKANLQSADGQARCQVPTWNLRNSNIERFGQVICLLSRTFQDLTGTHLIRLHVTVPFFTNHIPNGRITSLGLLIEFFNGLLGIKDC